jgi:hypothetical protein
LAILIKEGERMTPKHGEQPTKQASDEDGFTKVLRKKKGRDTIQKPNFMIKIETLKCKVVMTIEGW